VTHPRIYKPATPLSDAILQVGYWMESPTLRLLGEGPNYWDHLRSILSAGICQAAAVSQLWTADRDYSRFAGIPLRNPLVSS
jgi:hypothetical protein